MQVDEEKFPSLPGGPAKAGTPSPAKSAYHSAASSLWGKSPEKPAAAPQHAQRDANPQHAQHDTASQHAQHDAAPQHDMNERHGAYEADGDYHEVSEPTHQVESWNQDANLQDETSLHQNADGGVQQGDDRSAPEGPGDAAKWWGQHQPAGYQHEDNQQQQAGAVTSAEAYQQQGFWGEQQPPSGADEQQAHHHQGGWEQPQAPVSSLPYQPPDTWPQQGTWDQPQQQGSWEQPQLPADDIPGVLQGSWGQHQQQAANDPWQQQTGYDQAAQTGYTDNTAHGYVQDQGPTHNNWDTPQEHARGNQQHRGGHSSQQQQQGGYSKGTWEQPSGGQLQWQNSLPQTAAWDSNPSPDRPSLHAERQVGAAECS